MATRPAEVRIRAWTWRSDDTPRTVPGMRLYTANGRGVFVSFAEAHNLADAIVDYTEQQEEARSQA